MASKEEKALYSKIMQMLDKQMQPANNPAQDMLTTAALGDAEKLKKREFSGLSGIFDNFQLPSEQRKQYQNMTNIGAEGSFALGNDGGNSMALAKNFQADKFARDTALNYQDNIKETSGNVQNALLQSSGAKSGNDSAIMASLQGMVGRSPQGFQWSSLIGGALGAGNALASSFLGSSSRGFGLSSNDGISSAMSRNAIAQSVASGRGYVPGGIGI